MAKKSGPKGVLRVVLLILVAGVLWWIDYKKEADSGKPPSGTYETFNGCRWIDHRQNDGDSFRVKLPDGRVEQFRLYYVDAPESDFRTYGGGRSNHKRIHEQAMEFGITDAEAVKIGKKGKELVHDLLSKGTFTIYTVWDDPFGDHRYHAFVAPSSGPMIHELLVRKGLVRIHTKSADLPDGTSMREWSRELKRIENEAKRDRQGGWGL